MDVGAAATGVFASGAALTAKSCECSRSALGNTEHISGDITVDAGAAAVDVAAVTAVGLAAAKGPVAVKAAAVDGAAVVKAGAGVVDAVCA